MLAFWSMVISHLINGWAFVGQTVQTHRLRVDFTAAASDLLRNIHLPRRDTVVNTTTTTKTTTTTTTTTRERERELFYLTTHSTHFIYGYMASDIWLRTILIVRKETRCRHIGYSYRLATRVLLYAPSHRHDNTYHGLCYSSRGALAGMRNSSMCPPHEGSIRRPIAPSANALPLSYVPLLQQQQQH